MATRTYIGEPAWELRHRIGYNSDGTGRHAPPPDRHTNINSTFLARCDSFARHTNNLSVLFRSVGAQGRINWFGDVGFYVNKPGMHGLGRAWDVTRVQFALSGSDMNRGWRPSNSLRGRRRYLAIAAALRSRSAYVLTGYFNADHRDHIHFDNQVGMPPLSPRRRSDTVIVQMACNWLNGAGLAIDGIWGPLTNNAYDALLRRMNAKCLDPLTYSTHARAVLELIAMAGIANKPARWVTWRC